MQKITPFLWFDDNAEEAVNLYVSIFKNSKINSISRYGDVGPGQPGKVMTINFELDGLTITALNGGPHFKFTEAISLEVDCASQDEVDELWDKLISRWRRAEPMRLAQRQIWSVMADRTHGDDGLYTRSRPSRIAARDGRHAQNEQTRSR